MKRRIFALACVLVAAAWLASVAAACHSEITGSLNCAGMVSYTATAWNASYATEAGRTNTDVRVFVSTDNKSSWIWIGQGQFTKANGFSFSGTYQLQGSATSAVLRVQEFANWGTGDAPAPANYITVSRPSGCAPTTPPANTPPNNTPNTPPNNTPQQPVNNAVVAPAAPAAPVAPPSVSLVKLERVGPTGDFVAGPSDGTVGTTVYYKMVATNTGTTTISLNLTDDGCDAGTLTPVGPLALLPGASATFTCSHVLAAADGAQYINTALVTANNAGSQPATATASVTTNIKAPGAVAGVTKTIVKKKHVKHVKVKKVVKRAKPARAVIRSADFTG